MFKELTARKDMQNQLEAKYQLTLQLNEWG